MFFYFVFMLMLVLVCWVLRYTETGFKHFVHNQDPKLTLATHQMWVDCCSVSY